MGETSFMLRFLGWSLVIGQAGIVAHLSQRYVHQKLGDQTRIVQDGLIVCLITVLLTPGVWLVIWGFQWASAVGVPDVLSVAKYGVLFATGLLMLRRSFPVLDEVVDPTPDVEHPRLLRRLPIDLDTQILRLTVRDHCVDVVTSAGTHTIRSRFADAIDEMDPVLGHCTHRSHWVTRTAIESVERQAGKIHIRLVNGDLVPVSRKYKPGLEDAGVL